MVPVLFMLHERKLSKVHESCFQILKEKCPSITKSNFPIIIDREKAIKESIQKELPNLSILNCWNHVFSDMKFWLKSHAGNSTDALAYTASIKKCMQCENLDEFQNMLKSERMSWSQAMVTYFDDHLRQTIEENAGRWVLEAWNLYNPNTGITNNCGESLNAALKRIKQTWQDIPHDAMVLILFQLSCYYACEIMRGKCGIGNFELKEEFEHLNPERVEFPSIVCSPDEVIRLVRSEIVQNDREKIVERKEKGDTRKVEATTEGTKEMKEVIKNEEEEDGESDKYVEYTNNCSQYAWQNMSLKTKRLRWYLDLARF